MSERLPSTTVESQEINVDNAEMHNPELAAEFGRVVMEGMSSDTFTIPTMNEAAEAEPFGVDLAEAHEGSAPDSIDTDEATIAARGEDTYVLKMSTDWH